MAPLKHDLRKVERWGNTWLTHTHTCWAAVTHKPEGKRKCRSLGTDKLIENLSRDK
jgi:hypothetical protein